MSKSVEMVYDPIYGVLSFGMEEDLVDGRPRRTPATHPYNYDPFTLWKGEGKANNGAYSDRLHQWDYDKHNRCVEATGMKARDPKSVETYLRLYMGKPDLKLVEIVEHCNQSSGFPLWYYAWFDPHPDQQPGPHANRLNAIKVNQTK